MGQGQSSSSSPGSANGPEVKTSYYTLLGVERTATEDEIRKAYRRKALELHPDRNYGSEEAATKTFAEVGAAYEVLSDPQERAWYDSHESAILRGDDAGDGDAPTYENVRMTTADDLARMVSKFNRNVHFSDAPSGFFGFTRETFDQLAKEEEIAASWEDVEIIEYPTFGHKEDEYNDVVKQFYAAWSGFSTAKTFSWRDKYRLSEAPDRWYRRKMEQENNRLRKEGKQEFNDAVRALVAFVKKRDPRVVLNTQSEAERQKALREAAASQAARARAANAAKIATEDVPEWTKVRDPEELEESEEEEEDEEVFECVACNKVFKSERQWEAHEKSKKHQKSVKALQQTMRKQNAHLDLDENGVSDDIPAFEEDEEEQEVLLDVAVEVEAHHAQMDQEALDQMPQHDGEIIDEQFSSDSGSEKEPAAGSGNKTAPDAQVDAVSAEQRGEPSGSDDEDYASMATIQARMQSAALDDGEVAGSGHESPSAKPKMGKAAQKRAKKAAATAAAGEANSLHQCQVCNQEYPSKTKLFQHIEAQGHAALKSASGGSGGKGKRGKKR